MQIKKRKFNIVLLAGLIGAAIVVALVSILYVGFLNRTLQEETDDSLSEVSEHVSSMIDFRIESLFQNLTSISITCTQILNRWSRDEAEALPVQIDYLDNMVGQYEFMHLAVMKKGADGVWIAYTSRTEDGQSLAVRMVGPGDDPDGGILEYYDFLDGTLEGEQEITGQIHRPVDVNPEQDELVTYYAVPYYDTNAKGSRTVLGALLACTNSARFQDILGVESFGGEGYSLVIDRAGNFVFKPKHKNMPVGYENYFEMLTRDAKLESGYSLEAVRDEIDRNETGHLHYAMDGGEKQLMTYIPLSVPKWYLLTVVPASVTGVKSAAFIRMAVIINVGISLLFAVLTVLVVVMQSKYRKRLENVAFIDAVTGGYTRARFDIEARERIDAAPAGSYAAISMDIQRFKLINDAFGPESGDRVLKYVQQTTQEWLESDELVAHNSGDRFYLLVRCVGREQLDTRLKLLAQRINAFNDALADKYFIQLNFGVYIVSDKSLRMVGVEDRANVARKSKKSDLSAGLSQCAYYSDVTHHRLIEEKDMTNRAETAIASGEFEVFFQPKIELGHGMVCGAEALVRWRDPARGLVPPVKFIPLFESNGFIVKLDLYVFGQVLEFLQRWIDDGREPLPLSVNLSRAHLANPGFLDDYKTVFARYRVPASLIEIELTESMIYDNLEHLKKVIDEIHAVGFTCSMDDFGSGYSSLNILKDVNVDVLKIDRAFFNESTKAGERGRSVIESVVSLAAKLHMETVAEGVETRQQVEFLKQAHCDAIQGFVYAKPLPLKEFEKYIYPREEKYPKTEPDDGSGGALSAPTE